MILSKCNIEIPDNDEFITINKLSILFGLNTINPEKNIIITEGPLDSFLLPNAISICGIGNLELTEYFETGQLKYLFDKDETGTKAAIKKYKEGASVFLWKKFLKENFPSLYNNNNKVDVSDIFKIKGDKNINWYKYFSEANDKYALFEL